MSLTQYQKSKIRSLSNKFNKREIAEQIEASYEQVKRHCYFNNIRTVNGNLKKDRVEKTLSSHYRRIKELLGWIDTTAKLKGAFRQIQRIKDNREKDLLIDLMLDKREQLIKIC